MIVRETNAIYDFERKDLTRLDSVLTPQKALQLFDSMWDLARSSGALHRTDPLDGLEIDIEVARTVNALKETSGV